ncbi:MAG TPA: hypothetical protein VGI88_05575 [Verrucomicrobiae bacterium]|jgi:hypothetical protein
MPLALEKVSEAIRCFIGDGLAACVSALENGIHGQRRGDIEKFLITKNIGSDLFESALYIKRHFGQIDEVIHATGILLALPKILLPDEEISGLSLAAGNTGHQFDLETTHRVAEFTFISWRGGPEVIRQNKIFKDFFFLAEEPTSKRKELWVLGTEMPLKFFRSRRSVKAILKNNAKLSRRFEQIYPQNPFETVVEYYKKKSESVSICDLRPILPHF